MEGQITKHKWRRTQHVHTTCVYCKCERSSDRDGDHIYKPVGEIQWQLEKPECITRKITDNGSIKNV